MSDQPIDLIRTMPTLYYATELASRAGDALPTRYEHDLRKAAGEAYDALLDAIISADLTPAQRKAATAALETLRRTPADRARHTIAGHAITNTPREFIRRDQDRRAALLANNAAAAQAVHDELTASRTLLELLHTTAA
jgi:hypothetical protein